MKWETASTYYRLVRNQLCHNPGNSFYDLFDVKYIKEHPEPIMLEDLDNVLTEYTLIEGIDFCLEDLKNLRGFLSKGIDNNKIQKDNY